MKVNLTNINMIPLQVIFDTAVRHLLTQKEQSAHTDEQGIVTACYYRHPEKPGVMCAVGVLISDAEYKSTFEGEAARYVVSEINPAADIPRKLLLTRLQIIHDTFSPALWKEKLSALPTLIQTEFKKYRISLSLAVLDEFPD